MQSDLITTVVSWFILSAPLLIQVLQALVPVLALAVAGYALHLVAQHRRRGKK